ncbi:hypothetical protein L1887_59441 [Cichorium endivia]|nr:hypothetical protein L1887_59441 [Cichorium endivia]
MPAKALHVETRDVHLRVLGEQLGRGDRVLVLEQLLERVFDRHVAHTRSLADPLGSLVHAPKQRRKVNARSSDRDRTSSRQHAQLAHPRRNILGRACNAHLQAQVVAVSSNQIRSARRTNTDRRRRPTVVCTRSRAIDRARPGRIQSERLLHLLETLANVLLGHARERTDLRERSRHVVHLACHVDRGRNDGIRLLATQDLLLLDSSVRLLGHIRHCARQMDRVALALDVFKRIQHVAVPRAGRTVHRPLQVARSSRATIAIADARLELFVDAIQQRIACRSDTRRVIAVLVGKRTPFRSRVDDVLAHHKSAVSANQVARVKLLGQVRRVRLAVAADQSHIEIGDKIVLALGSIAAVGGITSAEREGLRERILLRPSNVGRHSGNALASLQRPAVNFSTVASRSTHCYDGVSSRERDACTLARATTWMSSHTPAAVARKTTQIEDGDVPVSCRRDRRNLRERGLSRCEKAVAAVEAAGVVCKSEADDGGERRRSNLPAICAEGH